MQASPPLLVRLPWYWIFQLAGWNVAALLTMPSLSFAPVTRAIIGVSWWGAASALLLSMAWRRVLQRRGWIHGRFAWPYVLPSLLLLTLLQCALAGLGYVVLQPFGPVTSLRWLPSALVSWFGLFLVWTVLYSLTQSLRRASRFEAETLRLQVLAKDAELRALQAQVNPHFFFNSLNSVRALVFENQEAAAGMVDQLAALMRYTLQSNQHETVPLGEEWQAVQTYLAIETIRFEDRLRVTMALDDGIEGVRIAPMALQTLVENAVKHGVEPNVAGSDIAISARRHDGVVTITVANTGALRAQSGSTRVGLANARQRLMLALGPAASLNLHVQAGSVHAVLQLPQQP
ncbi:sensor histidine kinase [Janthinobacterium sp. PC23-8]|uniref:sensor histidine kinase n=1 Tax=Janthinobacterium sp. PC23-8 TaxID=2012679 RepID=UPI000B963A6E|nr:histidine kinase [Janthinobacterium sp. PC23-8]OYO26276.1 sensor histidine kinase [Janthinobacterium sp. PC23-8]